MGVFSMQSENFAADPLRLAIEMKKKRGKQILKVQKIIFQDNVLAYKALSLLHYPICISEAECLLPFFIFTAINGFL